MSVVVHLRREWHCHESGKSTAWCGEVEGSVFLSFTDDISAATCRDCLESAREFGEQCRQRAERLRRGLPEPTR